MITLRSLWGGDRDHESDGATEVRPKASWVVSAKLLTKVKTASAKNAQTRLGENSGGVSQPP